MRIAIVGAGMAGLACADALSDGGFEITVFEKSRGTGGRLATRRSEAGSFDHGAQFATARSEAFKAYLKRAKKFGHAARWKTAAAGDAHWWTGRPGMSGLVKPLAASLDVRTGAKVEALEPREGGWALCFEKDECSERFDAVLLAVPVVQAQALLGELGRAFSGLDQVEIAPCWTALFAFKKRLGIDETVVRTDGAIAWAARESRRPKRQRHPERWVVQASAEWSRQHLEDAGAAVLEDLLRELGELSPKTLPKLIHADAHRWRYAKVETALGQPCVWSAGLGIGLAGDWCLAPRVEAAFTSGRALADAVMGTHGR